MENKRRETYIREANKKKRNRVKDAEKHIMRAGLVAGMRERTGLMSRAVSRYLSTLG